MQINTPYMVFSGDRANPVGGWADFKMWFESVEGARSYAEHLIEETEDNWAHIVHIDGTIIGSYVSLF